MILLSIICSFSYFICEYHISLYTSIFLIFGDFNDFFKGDLFLYELLSTWPVSTLNLAI